MLKILKSMLTAVILLSCLFLSANLVRAKVIHPNFSDSDYKAKYYSQSITDPIEIEAGQNKEIIVKFKNIGQKSWSPNDNNYVSVYTFNDKYRSSDFSNNNWLSKSHPVKISQITPIGKIGEFKINLTAPKKIGEYKEEFYLASENNSWIEGGYFYLKLNVIKPKIISQSLELTTKKFISELKLGDHNDEVKLLQTTLKDLGYFNHPKITGYFGSITKKAVIAYQKTENLSPFPGSVGPMTRAKLNTVLNEKLEIKKSSSLSNKPTTTASDIATNIISQPVVSTSLATKKPYSVKTTWISSNNITANAGEVINLSLKLTNNGSKQLKGYQWYLLGVYNNVGRIDNVFISHKSWLTNKKTPISIDIINLKSDVNSRFNLRVPHLKGNYKIKFLLISQNHKVSNSTIELSVNVLNNADDDYTPDIKIPDQDKIFLENEPLIKIGLYNPSKSVKVKTSAKYAIYNGDVFKNYLPANQIATLNYNNGKYSYSDNNLSFISDQPIKLKAVEANSYFEITNYTKTISWRNNVNYNKYLGNLKLETTSKGTLYLINELPLEDYMKGIRETDDNSNLEYIKSVLVAARSYAYYKLRRPRGIFDVYATTQDQLYLGYNSQIAMPNVVKAVIDTYGIMVTYNNEVVTTPYFGHSDGTTRSWSQVWGGSDKPWLQPVVAKYDKGLSMYGHGIGMSNRDASFRAIKDGWNYQQILKYYYTGVNVEQIY